MKSLFLLAFLVLPALTVTLPSPTVQVWNNVETYGSYTMDPKDTVISFDTTQSGNSVILASCNSNTGGQVVYIIDALGRAANNPINVISQPSETVLQLSSFQISTNFGVAFLICDSSSNWMGFRIG